MKKIATFLLLLGATLVFALPALGQAPTAVRGQVADEVNAVIPGASVTLTAVGGRQRTAVSNANGEFVFQNVAPGTYTLTVGFKGFQPYTDNNLKVPIASPLKIQMVVEAMNIETEVKGDDNLVTVEPDQNANATVLGEEFIKTLPDNEDDLRECRPRQAPTQHGCGWIARRERTRRWTRYSQACCQEESRRREKRRNDA